MVLLRWRGKLGGVCGVCDAHCYNARYPVCRCICGGRFHGVGRDGLPERIAALSAIELEQIEQGCRTSIPYGLYLESALGSVLASLTMKQTQLTLFTEG